VTETELRVTIAPQSSPHRTLAIAQLGDILTDTATNFPATNPRMRFAVRDDSRVKWRGLDVRRSGLDGWSLRRRPSACTWIPRGPLLRERLHHMPAARARLLSWGVR